MKKTENPVSLLANPPASPLALMQDFYLASTSLTGHPGKNKSFPVERYSPTLFLFAKIMSEMASYYHVDERLLTCGAEELENGGFLFSFAIRTEQIGHERSHAIHAAMERMLSDIALEDESGDLVINPYEMTLETQDKLSLLETLKSLFDNSDFELLSPDQITYAPLYDLAPIYSITSAEGIEMDAGDHDKMRGQQTLECLSMQAERYRRDNAGDPEELFLGLETRPFVTRSNVDAALYRNNAATTSVSFSHLYKTILQEEHAYEKAAAGLVLTGGYN